MTLVKTETRNIPFSSGEPGNFYYHQWIPKNPKAWLHIMHGMSEHGARYGEFAKFLNSKDIMVTAGDHRGHGITGQSMKSSYHIADNNGWEQMLDDQWELIKHIYSNHQLPLILLGHSMGSFLAMHFCQKYNSALSNQNAPQISGLILSGSSYSSPSTWRAALIIAQLERWRKGFDHSSALLEKMSFGAFNNAFEPARTESDWISRDHEVVDNYINDPLCGGPLSTQSWCDFLTGMIELTNLTALAKINSKLPTLLFSGQMDPVSNAGKGVTKLRDTLTKSGMENVAMHLYPGARHEALNEINSLDVFQDIIKWIEGLN